MGITIFRDTEYQHSILKTAGAVDTHISENEICFLFFTETYNSTHHRLWGVIQHLIFKPTSVSLLIKCPFRSTFAVFSLLSPKQLCAPFLPPQKSCKIPDADLTQVLFGLLYYCIFKMPTILLGGY